MTTAIILHGAAARQFGGPFHLEVRDPAEALRALLKMVKGFRSFVEAGEWKLIRGPKANAIKEGRDIDETELNIGFGRISEFHLVPIPAGAKKAGIGKIVAGVAIIALSIVTAGAFGAFAAGAAGMSAAVGGATAAAAGTLSVSYASIALFGASVLLGGISQMLAGNPKAAKVSSREDVTQRTNALFSGPVNVGELGNCLPLAYGPKVMCGSVVGTSGLTIEQVTP